MAPLLLKFIKNMGAPLKDKHQTLFSKLDPGIMLCNLGNHLDDYCIIAPSFRNIKHRSQVRQGAGQKSSLGCKWQQSKAEFQFFAHPSHHRLVKWANPKR